MPLPDIPTAGGDSARSAQGSISRDASGLVQRSNSASQLGDALAGLALQTKQLEAQNAEQADTLAAIRASADYEARVRTGIDALDPLAPDYEDQLSTTITEAKDAALSASGVASEMRRERLSAQFDAAGLGFSAQAVVNRRGVISKESARVFSEMADATMAKIQSDPDASGVYFAELMAQGEGALAGLAPEVRPAVMSSVYQAVAEARVRGYAEAGQFDTARALADQEQELLGAQGHRSLKAAITAEEQRQANERLVATQEQVAELDLTISRATNVQQLDEAQVALDLATTGGIFEGRPGQRVNLQQAIDLRRNKIAEAQTAVDDIVGRFTAGIGLNTEKEADTAWAWYVEAHVPEADRGDTNKLGAHLANFTASAGVMPAQAKQFIERAGRQTDPTLLGNAALLHGQITAMNPVADTGANDNVRATLALITHGGLDPQRAGEMALEMNRTPELRKRRQDELADPKGDLMTGALSEDEVFSSISSSISEGGFLSSWTDTSVETMLSNPATAGAAAEMAETYRGAFRQMYLLTGDQEVAAKHAGELVGMTYGESIFVAQNEPGDDRTAGVMRFAPENVLAMQTARPGDHLALDRDQTREVLRARLDRAVQSRYPNLDPRQVSLRPTAQTEFQLARGEQPTYAIYVNDPNIPGLTRPLVENGQPILMRLPTLTELKADPTYIGIAAKRQDEFDRFRRNRQTIRRGLEEVYSPSTPDSRARGRDAATRSQLGD